MIWIGAWQICEPVFKFIFRSSSSNLKRPFDGNDSLEEPSSDELPVKVPKTEFVEANMEATIEEISEQFSETEPIDYSLTSTSDDTASEVDKLKESPEPKNVENFQMFCHVCLKVFKIPKNHSEEELPVAQCFMCPKAIYCKNCIYSVNHLKIHSGLEINQE